MLKSFKKLRKISLAPQEIRMCEVEAKSLKVKKKKINSSGDFNLLQSVRTKSCIEILGGNRRAVGGWINQKRTEIIS